MLRAILPRGETLLIAAAFPGGLHQHRPRAKRLPDRGATRHGYVLDYDLFVLAVAIAFFVRHGLQHGFRNYEISLLAAAWLVPLLSRGFAGATGVPLGLMVMLAFTDSCCAARSRSRYCKRKAAAGASVMRFVLPCSAQS
jgi:hypothetical protein